jgi:hypothetical protein
VTLLNPLTQYYKFTFNSNGTGGNFDFAVFVAMETAFNGDGSEFGDGGSAGVDQLTALAAGMATGFETENAPNWDNITIVKIEAQPQALDQVYP